MDWRESGLRKEFWMTYSKLPKTKSHPNENRPRGGFGEGIPGAEGSWEDETGRIVIEELKSRDGFSHGSKSSSKTPLPSPWICPKMTGWRR